MNMNDGVITGKAMWCHLADTETFNGTDTNKYSITLVPSVEDMDNLMQEAQTIWEEFKETIKNKKFNADPNMGSYREDEDTGDASVKFVTNAHIVTKAGKEIDRTVPVFDGAERQVTNKIKGSIGNGSVVAVAYQLFPYYNTSKNFGVSFRLQAVQLLKYVPYGNGDASSYGFKKHAGAFDSSSVIDDVEEDTRSDVDIPFTGGSDDGDF